MKRAIGWWAQMGGGVRGVWTSYLPHPALPVPASYCGGSHLCVLFLLWNILPMLQNFSHFSGLPPLLDIPPPTLSSPSSRRLPAPITHGFPLPVPPPHTHKWLWDKLHESLEGVLHWAIFEKILAALLQSLWKVEPISTFCNDCSNEKEGEKCLLRGMLL